MERKRISEATWRRPSPFTSMGSAGGRGDHNRLFMPSSVPKAAAPKDFRKITTEDAKNTENEMPIHKMHNHKLSQDEMNRHEERMERDTRPICR